MSRKTRPTLTEEVEQIEARGSDCRFQLQQVGGLLKMLAEAMMERHVEASDPDYAPWASAEYLADQIGAHTAALGAVLDDLQRLGMRAGRHTALPRAASGVARLAVVGGTDDDAA